MSNYARVCIEVSENIKDKFDEWFNDHPLRQRIRDIYESNTGSKIYDIECNHYDRVIPSIEDWLSDNFDCEEFYVVGIDEYCHWENGCMECPHIWTDIIIDEDTTKKVTG